MWFSIGIPQNALGIIVNLPPSQLFVDLFRHVFFPPSLVQGRGKVSKFICSVFYRLKSSTCNLDRFINLLPMDSTVISMSQFFFRSLGLPKCIYHDYQIGDVTRKERKHRKLYLQMSFQVNCDDHYYFLWV